MASVRSTSKRMCRQLRGRVLPSAKCRRAQIYKSAACHVYISCHHIVSVFLHASQLQQYVKSKCLCGELPPNSCLRDSKDEFMKQGDCCRKPLGGAGSSLPRFWAGSGQAGTSDVC